ncbi:hypothetical protein NL676_011577 [Syzygium grande]|nr:hypothetical protein NL676_011577 [Syzygium grande]
MGAVQSGASGEGRAPYRFSIDRPPSVRPSPTAVRLSARVYAGYLVCLFSDRSRLLLFLWLRLSCVVGAVLC